MISPREGIENRPDLGKRLPRAGIGKLEGFGEELFAEIDLAGLGGHEPSTNDGFLLELGRRGARGERLEPLEGLCGVAKFIEKARAFEEAAFLERIPALWFGCHHHLVIGERFLGLSGELEAAGEVEVGLVLRGGIGEFVLGQFEEC